MTWIMVTQSSMIILALLLCGATCKSQAASADIDGFFEQSELAAAVELTETQEGFVGRTGTIWTISPSGAWQVARFVNDSVNAPHQTGQLSEEELEMLAEVFASNQFLALPADLTPDVAVNPHLITVRFGEQGSSLALEPNAEGADLADLIRDAGSDREEKLLAIVRVILDLVDP